MSIAKSYDHYLKCVADGMAKRLAIHEAAFMYGIKEEQLAEYADYWEAIEKG